MTDCQVGAGELVMKTVIFELGTRVFQVEQVDWSTSLEKEDHCSKKKDEGFWE